LSLLVDFPNGKAVFQPLLILPCVLFWLNSLDKEFQVLLANIILGTSSHICSMVMLD